MRGRRRRCVSREGKVRSEDDKENQKEKKDEKEGKRWKGGEIDIPYTKNFSHAEEWQ